MPKKPRLGLSAWLAVLVLGAILPLLVFAGFTLRSAYRTSRALVDRGHVDTTRALALAVDGEVGAWKAAVSALAESKSIQPGRLAEFYEEARQVGAQHDGWVVLTVASGEQLFNTLLPYGAPLQKTSAPETIAAIFRDGKPIVSDLIWGQNAQRYLVAVAAPVVRGGKVVHCLTLNFSPDRLNQLLRRQQFPATWVAAITDQQRTVVARSVRAYERVGKPVVDWFAAATRSADNGVVTGALTDGRLGQIAFQRLQEVPWIVALAVPVTELHLAGPIWGFLSVGVVLVLVATGIAVYIGREMTRPVRHLAGVSQSLLRGETGDPGPRSRIREVQELQQALVDAASAARTHAAERERDAEALRRANQELEARVAERTAELARANEALRSANAGLQEEIVQRRRAEAEVQALARFPSENPHPVLRLDSGGRILFANAASRALLRQWGTAVGRLAPAPWPDTVRGVLARDSSETTELACGDCTYAVFVVPVPDAAYVNLYMSDITDRIRVEASLRESRQDLNRAQAVAHTGSWRLNVRRNELSWSEENWQIFGVPKGTALTYETFLGTVHPEDRDYVHERWSAALRGAPYDIEHRIVVGGAVKWVRERAELEFDAEHNLLGGFGTTQDITARKEAEAALQQLNAELEHRVASRTDELSRAVATLERQAQQLRTLTTELTLAEQRERGRLANILHDELQQLLVATRLRAHMLARTDEEQVRNGALEIVELVEKALADTRSLSGELNPPGLQRGGLLQSLEWLARRVAETHHLRVDLASPSAPLPLLPGDTAVLLYQAVRECLLNTAKYAQVSAASVTVAVADATLAVTVADDGVGFDPRRLRVAGGTDGGAGLLGIRERLEWVGGRLEISSVPGRGSRITLVVPLSGSGLPSTAPAPSAPATPEAASPAARRLRVLIVDDHALVRRGFATLLADVADLEVVGEAGDGQRAVELSRQLAPDVVLMDVNMPILNGIDATRVIHAEFPAIRVIGLSIFEEPGELEAMLSAGAAGCLSKNDGAEALLAAIREDRAPAA